MYSLFRDANSSNQQGVRVLTFLFPSVSNANLWGKIATCTLQTMAGSFAGLCILVAVGSVPLTSKCRGATLLVLFCPHSIFFEEPLKKNRSRACFFCVAIVRICSDGLFEAMVHFKRPKEKFPGTNWNEV